MSFDYPMRPILIFCSDSARRDSFGRGIERVEGWCVSSAPILGLLFQNPETGYEYIPYGFSRPDVGAAYPGYPQSEKAGFRLSRPNLCSPLPRLCAEIETVPGVRERHVVPVNLETRDVQTFALDESTRLSDGADDSAKRAYAEARDFEPRLRRLLNSQRGLTLRLDIINKCNLRCVMCHFSDEAVFKRPTQQLTADQFKELFDKIGPDVREVALSCGDEPLTSKFLPEIVRYLAADHPQVAVEFCTNATLLSAPVRNLIMETGVARLLFSIDAVSKTVLEKIRVGCKYERIVANILALRDLKLHYDSRAPEFIFNFVMMERNIHEAPAFVRMAKLLGAAAIDFRHMVPIGTYFEPDQLLSRVPAKFNYYREKIILAANAHNLIYSLPAPLDTKDRWEPDNADEIELTDFFAVEPDAAGPSLPRRITHFDLETLTKSREGSAAEEFSTTFCHRPFSEIMVRDQKDVLPCPWHARPLGRLGDGRDLQEIFFGSEFQRLRQNMFKPEGDPGCARCPIKSGHLPNVMTTGG